MTTKALCLVALSAFVLVVYFWNLGGGSLKLWDESLTAERSREILVTGNWLTPHGGLIPNFNKPPLYYWLTAASFGLFGQNEFTVRLWSVLFGIGGMVFVYLFARNLSGDWRAGALGAFLLATNAHWIANTREGMLDSGMIFWTLFGIYWLSGPRPSAGRLVLSSLGFAAGCLVKNPLPLLGLIVPLAEQRFVENVRPRWRSLAAGLLLSALLGMAWYAIQYLKYGPVFLREFGTDNLLVNLDSSIDGHAGPWYFYLELWWGGSTLSMGLFLFPLLWFGARDRAALRPFVPFLLFIALALALVSVSASKRGTYLLVIHPFVAVVSAGLWHALLSSGAKPPWRIAVATLLVVASAALLVARFKPTIDGSPDLKDAALNIRAAAQPGDIVLTTRLPSELPMFYSRVPTYFTFGARPSASLRAHADARRAFILAPVSERETIRDDLESAGLPSWLEFENAGWIVLRTSPTLP